MVEERFDKPTHRDTEQYAESTKEWHLKHVNTRHRTLMRMMIAGVNPYEAGKDLGYSVAGVNLVINSPLFKEELAKMEGEVNAEFAKTEGSRAHTDLIRHKIKDEAMASLDTLVGLRDKSDSDRVRQLSAIEILDRAGYKATDKIEAEVAIDASDGLCRAIAEAMKEMRSPSSTATDTTTDKMEGEDSGKPEC